MLPTRKNIYTEVVIADYCSGCNKMCNKKCTDWNQAPNHVEPSVINKSLKLSFSWSHYYYEIDDKIRNIYKLKFTPIREVSRFSGIHSVTAICISEQRISILALRKSKNTVIVSLNFLFLREVLVINIYFLVQWSVPRLVDLTAP